MNRLILLGNGFDLAHGMPTRYFDFVFEYIRSSFGEAKVKSQYEDELIKIKRLDFYPAMSIDKFTNLSEFLYFRTTAKNSGKAIRVGLTEVYEKEQKAYSFDVKSSFFNHLLDHCCDYNWVDIENEYYRELKEVLQSRNDPKTELSNLNSSLALIIQKLEKYLLSLPSTGAINRFGKIFSEKIKKDEVVTVKLEEDISPESIQILNFNYTNTATRYILRSSDIKINYIHGELNNINNPLIFGFGDELDDSYTKIESDRRKGFLKFIKSFWYFKTSNYHHLIRFIESNDFQVYILGHSCGLSDRTMLNMIFEHTNCKSIKIFYHRVANEDNYTELTEEISRHFRNKVEMRKKIVPKEESQEMPQII